MDQPMTRHQRLILVVRGEYQPGGDPEAVYQAGVRSGALFVFQPVTGAELAELVDQWSLTLHRSVRGKRVYTHFLKILEG